MLNSNWHCWMSSRSIRGRTITTIPPTGVPIMYSVNGIRITWMRRFPVHGGVGVRARPHHGDQPFGGPRQDLNQRIAVERATQLQERHLALLYAGLGSRAASRERAARISTPSVRIAAEIRSAV